MKIRKIRVEGDVAICLSDDATNYTHEVNLANSKYDLAVNDSYFKVVDGAPVQKTQEDLDAEQLVADKLSWANERDRLQSVAVVKFDGHYFDMSPEHRADLRDVMEDAKRRNKKRSWRCKDASTLSHARYELSRGNMEDITSALIDALEVIDLAAESGMPVDPWPIEVA